MSPDEFLSCITILTGLTKDKIIVADALDYFIDFVEGIKMNNILSLPRLFKQIGFID